MVKKNTSQLILITGLSGSGKTVALQSLEDLGFYCIDNLSPLMIVKLIEFLKDNKNQEYKKIAISIDIRSLKMDKDFRKSIDKLYSLLSKLKVNMTTIFTYSSDEILISRFNAARRLHPLANNKSTLTDALLKEGEMMQHLKEKSNLIIDTSLLSNNELKEQIISRVSTIKDSKDISILIQSFGYKNNLPVNSDFVFDVRCIKNPYWEKNLRSLTGKDKKVIAFLKSDVLSNKIENDIMKFVQTLIPKFISSDRHYLTISIGCTGGKHRSVYISENISSKLSKRYNNIILKHRDLK